MFGRSFFSCRRVLARFVALAVLAVLASPAMAFQPTGRPDPRSMSGIPRVDPNIAAGTITVRCLRGSFAEPAVGNDVRLELTSADGATSTVRTATAAEQGRAVFDGLADYIGGTAVASTSFEGETQRSRPIPLASQAGTAVLLVKGASTTAPGASGTGSSVATPGQPPAGHAAAAQAVDGSQPAGAAHNAGMPEPGRPFPLRERPDGTLVVGVFDLATSQPVIGAETRLHVDVPGDDADPAPLEQISGADGRALYEGLTGESYPEGTKFRVEAAVEAKGPLQSSESFAMTGGHGWALVFIRGSAAARGPAGPAAKRRRPTAARADASLPAGSVSVRVFDSSDAVVADHAVSIVQRTMGGKDQRYAGRTGDDGIAQIDGIAVARDALYFAVAPFQGAPFRTTSFRLEASRGARVELQVYPVTADVSRLRSAAQFDVMGLEDDRARVLHMYEAVLEGEQAFWAPGGMKLYAADGGTGVRVMRGAETWLAEIEDAPYAELMQPLLPGERLVLSIAYLMRHDGELVFDWKAPFPMADARASMETGLRVDKGASGPAEASKSESHPDASVHLFPLTVGEYVDGVCQSAWKQDPASRCDEERVREGGAAVQFIVAGLPAQDPTVRNLGIGVGGLLAFAVFFGVIVGGSVSPRDGLLRKREALLERVRALDPGKDQLVYDRAVAALDRIYRQLDAFEASDRSRDGSKPRPSA